MPETHGELLQIHISIFLHHLAHLLHGHTELHKVKQTHGIKRLFHRNRHRFCQFHIIHQFVNLFFILRGKGKQLSPGTLLIPPEGQHLSIQLSGKKHFFFNYLYAIAQGANLLPQLMQPAAFPCSGQPVNAIVNQVPLSFPTGALSAGYCILFKYLRCKSCLLQQNACRHTGNSATHDHYFFHKLLTSFSPDLPPSPLPADQSPDSLHIFPQFPEYSTRRRWRSPADLPL